MTLLKILTYPEKSLSLPSAPLEEITDEVIALTKDMGETMFEAPGVGLAAPQVGVNKRIIVYDSNAGNPEADREQKEFTALINPEITAASGSIVSEEEGCLSVVDYTSDVKRYETVTVKAQDIDGNPVEFEAKGILAVIMQHEIDHLDGILFIDRISVLKRSIYKKKLSKKLKEKE
ncbi:MAG: peptide deformylase [Proteobacteria bacterium]|nr:peptide deformylase [Pseudomonadota bacterium]MBU1388764.1 peptide deformylase [Pseudomonadota bacterium]MBU1543105.1 peptide deformylase [Pseudomonadota bacterium]MBU2431402.1 peptide deformylase [Pseudomonadota bacterium]MBU2483167.1 peptide deformylase [Pseudomonadota bacterium]